MKITTSFHDWPGTGLPKTQNPAWGFYGTCETLGHADPDTAWNEAMHELINDAGLFRFEPDVARDLLDSPWGRHLADEIVGGEFEEVIGELAKDRRWMKSTLAIAKAIVLARADDGDR